MSSSVTTTTNGVVVITHVHPAGNTLGVGGPSPPHCMGQVGQVVSSVLGMFRRGHPKALGTVQIMFGAMSFLIGIVMAVHAETIGVFSGIFVWGAAFYIIAGSLTIATDKNLNKCLVKASLGMNIVATVTAGIGTVLYSLDTAALFIYCYDGFYPDYYYQCDYQYKSTSQGISGVMVVFSVLEFMVSICVSSFACKAVCHSTPEQVFVIGNHLPQGGIVAPQTPNYETMPYPKGPEEGIAAHPNNLPPQYSPATIP